MKTTLKTTLAAAFAGFISSAMAEPGFTVLNQLPVAPATGIGPTPLVRASDGNFYGFTASTTGHGAGTFFKMTSRGRYTELLALPGGPGALGFPATTPPTQGQDGNFYGVSVGGGENNTGGIFRVSRKGAYKILMQFPAFGLSVSGGLVVGRNGHLYGVSSSGVNCGFIFELSKSGSTLTHVHDFQCGVDDGGSPRNGLTLGPDGMLYGSVDSGTLNGVGGIYRFNPTNGALTLLHSFSWPGEGDSVAGALTVDPQGNVYGNLSSTYGAYGKIWKIDSSGVFSIIHVFTTYDQNHTAQVYGSMTLGSDGFLYGTGSLGGYQFTGGGIFRLARDGSSFADLHIFNDPAHDGSHPYGGLVEGAPGVFYGANFSNGGNILGTLWKWKS